MRFCVLGALLLATACAGPDLSTSLFACQSDADCLDGKVCGTHGGARACVPRDTDPIRLGMTGPLQGPSQSLGVEMRRGILAEFQSVNDQGGLFGRMLSLDCLNDNYDPAQALSNTRTLLDIRQDVAAPDAPDNRGPNGVLSLIGSIGTPTMLVTAPVATKNHVVFFAPFSGAQTYLRDGTDSPYVYNYRAGYYEEMAAIVDYLKDNRVPRVITEPSSYTHLLAFTQHDSYGDAGYAGLLNAYNTRVGALPNTDGGGAIHRVQYERENVTSVDPAILDAEAFLSKFLGNGQQRQSVAIAMVDTYQPANKFIRAIKDWLNQDLTRAQNLDVAFINVSFVGSDSLAQALRNAPDTYQDITDPNGMRKGSYGDGVWVTQVVPSYAAKSPGVTAYRQAIKALDDGNYSFTSLEGYIAASLFVEALRRNGPTITNDSLRNTLDTQLTQVDLGFGTPLGFSSLNHQASHSVWGSTLDKTGNFRIPFSWTPEGRVRVEAE